MDNVESGKLTDLMKGRMVRCVIREGLELVIRFDDGLEVSLEAGENGEIFYKKHVTKVTLVNTGLCSELGIMGK